MKFFTILIFFGISLTVGIVAAASVVEYKLQCNVVQKYFNVCKEGNILWSVSKLRSYQFSIGMLEPHLYIKDNSISSIARNAFNQNISLDITGLSLELGNCELGLEQDSFNGLQQLQILDIISGIVRPTPNLFESINSLIHLTLSFRSHDEYFKQSLSILKNLTELKIVNTTFPTITSNTFYNVVPTIKRLFLYGNIINEIKFFAFSTFKKLEILEIVNDRLIDFERGALHDLESLKCLKISQQRLREIKNNTFINLKNLKNLNITHNKIIKIEKGTFSRLNLQVLDLSHNDIAVIESESFYSSNIDELILSFNPIFKISNNAFMQCSFMKIYFSNTPVTDIELNIWGLITPNLTGIITNSQTISL